MGRGNLKTIRETITGANTVKTKTRILEEIYDTVMNNDQYQKEFNLAENPDIYPYLDYASNEIVLDINNKSYVLKIQERKECLSK